MDLKAKEIKANWWKLSMYRCETAHTDPFCSCIRIISEKQKFYCNFSIKNYVSFTGAINLSDSGVTR